MKKNRILILGIWPVIGLGVNGLSYATDSRVDDYVPKSEYEKLKREVETLKGQMQRLLEAAPATPESKSAAAEAQGEKKPVTGSKESVGRSDQQEFEAARGPRLQLLAVLLGQLNFRCDSHIVSLCTEETRKS